MITSWPCIYPCLVLQANKRGMVRQAVNTLPNGGISPASGTTLPEIRHYLGDLSRQNGPIAELR